MLGFHARSDGGEPIAHDGELEDVRWFTRDAIHAGLSESGAELRLPPNISIARFLVERWVAQGG
jgi:NAD+ diphosphatase